MMHLCWATLLLCLSAHAEDRTFWRESGGTVTLKCSYEGCPRSSDRYHGMYLYQYQKTRREVIYYHSRPGSHDKITPRRGYMGRIQTNGPLKNHTITISNLTVEDSGFYRCVYLEVNKDEELRCDTYTVFVKGVASCPGPAEVPCAHASEKSPSLALIIAATCTISTLVTMIFILLMVPRVRRWTRNRRAANAPQASNEYVYEVMTKNDPRPAPPHSTPSLYDCA